MRRIPLWGSLVAAVGLLLPGAADAQSFSPPVNPYYFQLGQAGIKRLTIGTFWSRWELTAVKISGVTVHRDSNASPLIEGEYQMTRHAAVGGWWNRVAGSDYQTGRPGLPHRFEDLSFVFWDLHARYYLPEEWAKGWSVQIGVSSLDFDVNPVPQVRALGAPRQTGTFRSPNFWLNKTQRVVGRSDDPSGHPVDLYASVGYIPSPGLGDSNVILGGSVGLSGSFRLSGSVWLNDLQDLSLRTTVGVVGSF